MKCAMLLTLAMALQASSLKVASEGIPIKRVLTMISELQDKIIAEGTSGQKLYAKKTEFCEERASKLSYEIKTGKAEIDDLKATIDEQTAVHAVSTSKIEELSADLSADEADLKAATAIREKEGADYANEERQSKEVIDSLDRAISILTKEMAKKGASMLQLKSASGITEALALLVQGSAMSSYDASKLTSLVQQNGESDDTDDEFSRATAAASQGRSDGIVGVLEGLLEKAEGQLDKARKSEATSLQDYKMLKQSLTDEMKYADKDLSAAKKALAQAQEKKSVATGDLDTTSKDLSGDVKARSALHHDCMTAAQEFELSVKARAEELKALTTAKKILVEMTGGAAKKSLVQKDQDEDADESDSFLQVVSRSSTNKAVRLIRELAQTQHSSALAQLASRMAAVVRFGANGGHDPFGKVKKLISGMLTKLEGEAAGEANQKAYCDKELKDTKEKLDEKSTELESLSTKLAQKRSASGKLQEQVSTLQKELTDMSSSIAAATQLRQQEKAEYTKNKAEMDQGLHGVQMALKVLREYYAKDAELVQVDQASNDAGGIIGLLEVVESDMTKALQEATAEEESGASEYEEFAQANKAEAAGKGQDSKYKTREYKALDKAASEISGDLAGVSDEKDAIVEYDEKIKQSCIAKAEPYAEKKKRREQEIEGLKDALATLDQEASLLQTTSKRTLRRAVKCEDNDAEARRIAKEVGFGAIEGCQNVEKYCDHPFLSSNLKSEFKEHCPKTCGWCTSFLRESGKITLKTKVTK